MLADRIHQQAQHRLRQTTGAQVAGVLLAADRRSTAAYAAAVAWIVAGGQRASVRLAAAYIAAYAPLLEPVNVARALRRILIGPDSDVAAAGLLRLSELLDQGVELELALTQAQAYASGLAQGALQDSERAGLDEAANAAGRRPRWRLQPDVGACDWCEFIASTGARYLTAGSVPVPHGTPSGGPCGCSPAPEF